MVDPVPFALGAFSIAGCHPFAAVVADGGAVAVRALLPHARAAGHAITDPDSLLGLLQDWGANFAALSAAVARWRAAPDPAPVPLAALRTHAPLEGARQVFCAGANYRKHVIEMIIDRFPDDDADSPAQRRQRAEAMMDERLATGAPYVFSKPASCIAGPFDTLTLPAASAEPDWEVELGVVFGLPTHAVPRAQAMAHVAGYVVVNDVSCRDLTFRKDLALIGSDWVRSKGHPGFLPMGPLFVPAAFVPDPHALRLRLSVNGQVMQDESTADMIYDIPRQIEYLSAIAQLSPGDVLATGSPAGNGTHHGRYLRPGDVIEAGIDGLGTQRTPCVGAAA